MFWRVFRIWQTRLTSSVSNTHDASEAKRAIANAQQELASQQRQSAADLAELRGRVTNVEKLLRDVGLPNLGPRFPPPDSERLSV